MTKRDPEPSDILELLAQGKTIERDEKLHFIKLFSSALRSEDVSTWDFDEIYEITVVAGKLRAPETTPLLERLLDSQEPITVCLVLDILCGDWGRSADYLERVMTFAVGAVWDDDQDVQEKAIEILGAYVAERMKDASDQGLATIGRVVELLWQQFASDEESEVIRRAAYRAMRIAYGRKNGLEKSALQSLGKLPQVQSASELGPEFDREALESILCLAPTAESSVT